jgi:3-oxoacyl-[acyl-carrier-protein] synthase-3
MAIFSVENIRLTGISACVPSKEFHNMDYDWIPVAERELLIKTTGVEKRRIADLGMTTADFCFVAAEKLLNEQKWNRTDIDVLIFVSQSRDFLLPCTGVILQNKLGLSKSTLAFDIPLGCSGFVYGISVIGSLLSKGTLKKGLLLVGDISTINCSVQDKSTYPLFGDAGTAATFEYDPNASPMYFNLQSDGAGWEAISIPDGGMRNFASKESFDYHNIEDGIIRNRVQLTLSGIDVFNFSLREVTPNINALLGAFGKTPEQFDYFIFHQANLLMNESIRKKLRLPKEKVPYTLPKYGNTSSASIPLTMVSEIRNELTSKKLSLLLCGFGVGLSWGTALIETDSIACPEVLDYNV